MKIDAVLKMVTDHISKEDKLMNLHNRVLFGEEETGEKGMVAKVDEIYTILTKVNGVGGLLKWLIIFGGALAVIKGWFLKL